MFGLHRLEYTARRKNPLQHRVHTIAPAPGLALQAASV
jgi:hypothetical protein